MQPADQPESNPQDRYSPAKRPWAGSWLVVALVLIGGVAGIVAVKHWSMRSQFVKGSDPAKPPAEGAGAATWDEAEALAQLQAAQEQFNLVAVEGHDAKPSLAAVQRIVERYPKYAAARTLLAQVWLYQSDFDKAYEQFKLSLELDPRQAEVHLLAGSVAIALDRIDRATHHYTMAVGLDQSSVRARLHLAQAYLRQRQDDKARRLLIEALTLDPSSHAAYALFADLYTRQNKLQVAIGQLIKAVSHTPETERSTVVAYTRRLAKLLRRDNQPQEALIRLRTLTPAERTDPDVLEDMALCWSMLGDPAAAAALFEQALAAYPAVWQYAARAAHWRIKAGDLDTARQHIELIRRLNSHAPGLADLESQTREKEQ